MILTLDKRANLDPPFLVLMLGKFQYSLFLKSFLILVSLI